MPRLPPPTDRRFVEFVAPLRDPGVAAELASASGLPAAEVAQRLELAVGEAAQTVRLLQGIELRPGERVLEVGAGLGVASGFVAALGHEVTALEPGGQGFEAHAALASRVATALSTRVAHLPLRAEELDVSEQGAFGLVFSNNVLEHVDEPERALAALVAVTERGRWCVHSCPNYHVPYEPHFGVPLLPLRPAWSARVLPRRIRGDSVWASLNFITSSTVRRVAASTAREVHFRPAALADSVDRLGSDEQFAARHTALARVAGLARRVGVVSALRRLPPSWSTPMHFALADHHMDHIEIEAWRRGEAATGGPKG